MPPKQSGKPTRKKCRVPRKCADPIILFAGILLALCLQYVFPSIRLVINYVWPAHTKLSERLSFLQTQLSDSLNKGAIILAIVVGVIAAVIIVTLVILRHDRSDDTLDEILTEVKGLREDLSGGGNDTKEGEAIKEKTSKKGKTKDRKT